MNLPASIASPEDLQAVVQELKEYAKWSSHVAVRQKALQAKGHSHTTSADHATSQPMLSGAAKALIHDQSSRAPLTADSMDTLITDIEQLAANAPHFTITLAAPPTPGVRKNIVAWCRDNISPDVLVSFAFSRVILGGMVVRSGSHIHDWSHRRAILENNYAFAPTFHQIAGTLDILTKGNDTITAAVDTALAAQPAAELETTVPTSPEDEAGPIAERGA